MIFALTTPPERTFKLAPQWKGPYRVCCIPNEYEVVYEDGEVECTIHINHAKPTKFTSPDLPELVPPMEEPRPPLGYLPVGFIQKPAKPRAPPVSRIVAARPPQPLQPLQQFQPRQPIKIQNQLHLAGALPGSIPS